MASIGQHHKVFVVDKSSDTVVGEWESIRSFARFLRVSRGKLSPIIGKPLSDQKDSKFVISFTPKKEEIVKIDMRRTWKCEVHNVYVSKEQKYCPLCRFESRGHKPVNMKIDHD